MTGSYFYGKGVCVCVCGVDFCPNLKTYLNPITTSIYSYT